jgi:hypothetical protein
MKRSVIVSAGLLIGNAVCADSLQNVDRLLCAAGQVLACFEEGDCVSLLPEEADVPQFVVVDLANKVVSTTRASNENRSTAFASMVRSDGVIYLQGIELGRAFSFVIDEVSGRITVAVSRDGLSVTVFGACTNAEV